MAELCLYCSGEDRSYKPGPEVEFVCRSCVQLLLNKTQADLQRAHGECLEKGYD